jgi:hypothetical protein
MEYADRINTEPHFNLAVAFDIGIRTPDMISMKDMSDDDQKKLLADGSWTWISGTTTAMKKLRGCRASFHAHWNGEKIGHFFVSVNDRAMFGIDMGPELVSNCMTVWAGQSRVVTPYLENLIKQVVARDPDFRGFVDVEAVLDGGEAIYQNITVGALPEFVWTLAALYDKPIEDIFVSDDPPSGFGCCMRLFKYPYSLQTNQSVAQAVPVSDLKWDGESFVAIGRGSQMKKAWRDVYSKAAGLEKYGVIYRRDGDVLPRRTMFELKLGKYL